MSNLRPRTAMLLAIKLLVALSVLSYAVAMVLTTSDSTAFQPPISHFLGRNNGKNEDYLTLKVRRISHTWGRRGVKRSVPSASTQARGALPWRFRGGVLTVSIVCCVSRHVARPVQSTVKRKSWKGAYGIDRSILKSLIGDLSPRSTDYE